jgi:hypothetical protein
MAAEKRFGWIVFGGACTCALLVHGTGRHMYEAA